MLSKEKAAALLAEPPTSGRGAEKRWSPEIREARRKIMNQRRSRARDRAVSALARLHPEDFRVLYDTALSEINTKDGPLPGD